MVDHSQSFESGEPVAGATAASQFAHRLLVLCLGLGEYVRRDSPHAYAEWFALLNGHDVDGQHVPAGDRDERPVERDLVDVPQRTKRELERVEIVGRLQVNEAGVDVRIDPVDSRLTGVLGIPAAKDPFGHAIGQQLAGDGMLTHGRRRLLDQGRVRVAEDRSVLLLGPLGEGLRGGPERLAGTRIDRAADCVLVLEPLPALKDQCVCRPADEIRRRISLGYQTQFLLPVEQRASPEVVQCVGRQMVLSLRVVDVRRLADQETQVDPGP